MKTPWRIETVTIVTTKHFGFKYMMRWRWTEEILQDAIRRAYRIEKTGRNKFELYTRKNGYKKIIVAYEEERIICISGAQGGRT